MAFSIKDEASDSVVRKLAALTGESYTKAVLHAAMEKLARLQKTTQTAKAERNRKLDAFLKTRRNIREKSWSQKNATDDLWGHSA